LIVASGGGRSALAAKSATSTIPIIFSAGDPIVIGLVASLNRPGGNVTGFSIITVELHPKLLELLSELVPQAGVIALLVNPNNPNAERAMRDVQEAAGREGLPIVRASVEDEIETAFASLVQQQAGALVVGADAFFNSQPARSARGIGITPCHSGDL
jgi:putative tryptophan/tyrosine transport system substrate-binding protein